MPDTYHVILTAEALADLEQTADYIRQNSPQAAAGVAETILKAIDSLAFMPTRWQRVGKSRSRGSPVHAMLVRPYIVYYRIEDSPTAVRVLTIRHGGRRQPRRSE